MSCYHPLKAFRTPTGVVFQELSRHDIVGSIELPCGMCIGCRMRRASDWALRVRHEASFWDQNCFVTLTYAPEHLPAGGSLDHRHFQLFMKRLRRAGYRVRFYMCGEYGPQGGRPHYHACLFNVGFAGDRVPLGTSASGMPFFESAELSRLWGLGRASVQDLTPETASYCARYIMKKALGEAAKTAYRSVDADGVITELRPEYAAMSLKPGIGARWAAKYARDVYPMDAVVADGNEHRPPKYYDKLLKRNDPLLKESIDFERELRAREAHADNTDERRRVREVVHLARVRNLKRDLS